VGEIETPIPLALEGAIGAISLGQSLEAQMKVFISWSGDLSRQLAEAIREWLPNVLQFVKPYFTPSDLEKGARWDNEISKELGQSSIGIFAMTEESLTSPWIMFEAGAISTVVEKARAVRLFSVSRRQTWWDLSQAFRQQHLTVEVRQLLTTINNAAPEEVAVAEKTLDASFNKWWSDLEQAVQAISAAQPPTEPQRSVEDLLEEAVSNTRAIFRELQAPRPLQVFAPNREMEAFVKALMKPQRGLGNTDAEDKAEMAGVLRANGQFRPHQQGCLRCGFS
jgi:TIR domain